ncbi:hypothetical protein GDO81_027229 [Engystomops pustulosus]|uniref:Uncharacterized protein n=1 Tax=Engystomops pustulosus TaxID=76066 RepID=A0AAV6ZPJ6_ENGPU|nr:hypothetical protein GDO81_027229 [Engystomops pustulosus]
MSPTGCTLEVGVMSLVTSDHVTPVVTRHCFLLQARSCIVGSHTSSDDITAGAALCLTGP